jgi:hypothetical protein
MERVLIGKREGNKQGKRLKKRGKEEGGEEERRGKGNDKYVFSINFDLNLSFFIISI